MECTNVRSHTHFLFRSKHLLIWDANLPPAIFLPQLRHWKYLDVSNCFNFDLSWIVEFSISVLFSSLVPPLLAIIEAVPLELRLALDEFNNEEWSLMLVKLVNVCCLMILLIRSFNIESALKRKIIVSINFQLNTIWQL